MRKYLFIVLVALLLVGCTSLKKVEQTKELMSTYYTITVYDTDEGKANNSIEKAFEEIQRIDDVLSIYKNSSEANRLNEDGFIENASYDLLYNVERSLYYANLSDGAFDITVQPILDLYTHTFNDLKRPPTEEEINETLILINYKNIILSKDKKSIKLSKKGMKITLGGIAKGYAVERAIDILNKEGIQHALVNAGGNMRAIGNKGTEDWQIALENPRNKQEYITIIPLNNNAVSTSGDYERYFNENKTFHHIVNPKTGYSAIELISVTIITDNAMDADALSTSVFVLGKEKGLKLIEDLGVKGLIITREKGIIKSSGFHY